MVARRRRFVINKLPGPQWPRPAIALSCTAPEFDSYEAMNNLGVPPIPGIRLCVVLAIDRYRVVPRERHCVLRGRLTARALYFAIPLMFCAIVARWTFANLDMSEIPSTFPAHRCIPELSSNYP